MPGYKSIVVAFVLVLTLVAGAFAAMDSPTTAARTTYLTFNGAVALPGVVLPAGTYTFERVDPTNRGDVVRILARNRSKVYLTAFTRLISRPENMSPNQLVTFSEARRGVPPRITAWFPKGERVGHAFVY